MVFREGVKPLVREAQAGFVAFGEEFETYLGVAGIIGVAPLVGEFAVRVHFGDFAEMAVLPLFAACRKFKFEAGLRFEIGQVEIPLLHLPGVRQGFPYPRGRCI